MPFSLHQKSTKNKIHTIYHRSTSSLLYILHTSFSINFQSSQNNTPFIIIFIILYNTNLTSHHLPTKSKPYSIHHHHQYTIQFQLHFSSNPNQLKIIYNSSSLSSYYTIMTSPPITFRPSQNLIGSTTPTTTISNFDFIIHKPSINSKSYTIHHYHHYLYNSKSTLNHPSTKSKSYRVGHPYHHHREFWLDFSSPSTNSKSYKTLKSLQTNSVDRFSVLKSLYRLQISHTKNFHSPRNFHLLYNKKPLFNALNAKSLLFDVLKYRLFLEFIPSQNALFHLDSKHQILTWLIEGHFFTTFSFSSIF